MPFLKIANQLFRPYVNQCHTGSFSSALKTASADAKGSNVIPPNLSPAL